MESADLRSFEAVARLGVMTRAADELHTVQSNVTARIQAAREAARLQEARAVTFKQAAERYIAAHEAAWRNPGAQAALVEHP